MRDHYEQTHPLADYCQHAGVGKACRPCRHLATAAAREALDGLSKWLGELHERYPSRSEHTPRIQGQITRYTTDHHPEETAMSTDEYVPNEAEMREAHVWLSAGDNEGAREQAAEDFNRGLARVRRDAKAEALREAAENVDVGSLADAWTRGAITRASVTNAVTEVLMSLRARATEHETGADHDE